MLNRKHTVVATLVLGAAVVAVGAIRVSNATTGGDHILPANETLATGTSAISHVAQTVDGASWSVSTYTNALGEHCMTDVPPTASPADDGGALNCISPSNRFANGPVAWSIGARQQPGDALNWADVWVYGEAASSVAQIEVVTSSCASRRVALDSSGVFLAVFPRSLLAAGGWPYRLVARSSNGQVLLDRVLPVSPPPTPAAIAAGVKAPSAAPACARP